MAEQRAASDWSSLSAEDVVALVSRWLQPQVLDELNAPEELRAQLVGARSAALRQAMARAHSAAVDAELAGVLNKPDALLHSPGAPTRWAEDAAALGALAGDGTVASARWCVALGALEKHVATLSSLPLALSEEARGAWDAFHAARPRATNRGRTAHALAWVQRNRTTGLIVLGAFVFSVGLVKALERDVFEDGHRASWLVAKQIGGVLGTFGGWLGLGAWFNREIREWVTSQVTRTVGGIVLAALGVLAGVWMLYASRDYTRYYVRCEPQNARVVYTEVGGVERTVCGASVWLRRDAELVVEADGYEPFRAQVSALPCPSGERSCTVYLQKTRWRFWGESAPVRHTDDLCVLADGTRVEGETMSWAVLVQPPSLPSETFLLGTGERLRYHDGRRVELHPRTVSELGCVMNHKGNGFNLLVFTQQCGANGSSLSLEVRACRHPRAELQNQFELTVFTEGSRENGIPIEFSDHPVGVLGRAARANAGAMRAHE